MNPIYLDNHTTTKPCTASWERMQTYGKEKWGIPSAPHTLGKEAADQLENHYQQIYDLVEANPEDSFVFCSSSSEPVNHLILSTYFDIVRKTGKNQFVTCVAEDAPLLLSLQRLEELGCKVKTIPLLANGQIDTAALQEALNPKTALVSFSWAHGITGVIQPVEEIAGICAKAGVPLHLDATYALGKVYISLKDILVAYLTFSGDRLHAPKSTGGVFIHRDFSLSPLLVGGKEQGGLRGSHLDMASFTALAAACQQAMLFQDQMSLEVARLRSLLERGIETEIPGALVLFKETLRLPNVLVASFPGIWHEALLYALNRKGLIATSGGGFCPILSKVLLSCGCNRMTSESALSFALSRNTTEEEIGQALLLLAAEVEKCREISRGLL